MPDSSERGGALASVFRMIKKKDGGSAIRIDRDTAQAEANKMAASRNPNPRTANGKASQQAGSSSYKDKPKKKK